jgi:hypothetical protein
MCNDFRKFPYVSLKDHYKSFAYITKNHSTKSKYTLKIGGDIINSWRWRNDPIMEYFTTRNLLCQFHWVNDTAAHLYFENKNRLKEASNWWLSKDHPNMLVEELDKDTRNDKDKKLSEIVADLPKQSTNNPLVNQLFNGDEHFIGSILE